MTRAQEVMDMLKCWSEKNIIIQKGSVTVLCINRFSGETNTNEMFES